MTDIIIPADLWDEDIEGNLLGWLYTDGSEVSEGEPVVEIMTEKVQNEILAPASGKLVQLVPEEAQVTKGQVIGRIDPAS